MNTQQAEQLLMTEHTSWLKGIDQYKGELSSMQHKLEDFAKNSITRKASAKVEQFQNRFIRQREVIDELRHEIKQHENHLEKMYVPDTRIYVEHIDLRDQFTRFFDLFVEMEQDFNEFVA